jgi:hypothetical protein
VVTVTDPYGRILGFLDRTFFYITYKIEFAPRRKRNTSPLCSQELWPLDHRGGPFNAIAKFTYTRVYIYVFNFSP